MKMVFVIIRARTRVLGTLAIFSLTPKIVVVESSRDDWQHLRSRVDFELRLDHSLEDAPLTAEERVQIIC